MSNLPEEPALCLDGRWLRDLHNSLDQWFDANARSFPWRETSDPFKILVAEKLLQQTAARDHVVAAYLELVSRYPEASRLAEAELEDVQAFIQPLGLLGRSEQLIELAKQLVANHDGKVPQELDSLQGLKGVGSYIARAVLCFGFGEDVAMVDTNIARWLYRLLLLRGPMPKNPARQRRLLDLATRLVPPGNAKRHNWAVLDLCAAICTAYLAKCEVCPLQGVCAFSTDTIDRR